MMADKVGHSREKIQNKLLSARCEKMINHIKYENPNDAIYHFFNVIDPILLISNLHLNCKSYP